MKKGNSKNRHFSKGVNNLKRRNKSNRHKELSHRATNNEAQATNKSSAWNRIGIIIQLADFLIDKVPRLLKWILFLLGMG